MKTFKEPGATDSGGPKAQKGAQTEPARSSASSLGAAITSLALAAGDHYVTSRKDRLMDAVVDIAAEVRRSGRRFEGQQDWIAEAIDIGASRIRDTAEKLRAADTYDLVRHGLELARKRPRAAMILVVLTGAVCARFIKHSWSSSPVRAASAH